MNGDLEVIHVIHTQLLLRGAGKPGDPMRRIEQFWGMDGRLLWEVDPFASPSPQPSRPEPEDVCTTCLHDARFHVAHVLACMVCSCSRFAAGPVPVTR